MAAADSALANAVTIEAPRRAIAAGRQLVGTRSHKSARRRVALVEGSTPHMSDETRSLLRRRLRIVGACCCSSASARSWSGCWRCRRSTADLDGRAASAWLARRRHGCCSGLLAWKLCAKCDLSLPALRVAEALVFGAPAFFFLILDYERLVVNASLRRARPTSRTIVSGWMLLIFCYAMFVPNTWQRAAIVIGAARRRADRRQPVRLLDGSRRSPHLVERPISAARSPSKRSRWRSPRMTAIVGVHSIGALRREAFVAKQLGQYRLKKLLGSGGMGEVYLAEHQMMKRPCAVKVIRPEKAGDPQVLARFEREVRATAKLSHWNSIDIYDYGRTDDGTFYYVMEFLPGPQPGRAGRRPRPAARRRGSCTSCGKCATRWPRPTATGWCIATSSRRTSSAPTAAACSTWPSCSTSAWPSR